MAQVLFLGSEPADFVPYGSTGFDATATSPYRRGVLTVTGGDDTLNSHHLDADLTELVSTFWATLRVTTDATAALPTRPFLIFRNGFIPVAGLGLDDGKLAVIGFDGETPVVLATSAQGASYVADAKIDLYLDLGTGKVRVWTNGVLMLDGTVAASGFGAPTIDSLSLLSTGAASTKFSEIAVAKFDLRAARIATLAPNADDATAKDWSGSFADVADADWQAADTAITASLAESVSAFPLPNLPTASAVVRAVKLSAVASRGDGGPQSVQLGTDPGTGTITYSPATTPDPVATRLSRYLEAEPASGAAWTAAQVNALRLAIKASA